MGQRDEKEGEKRRKIRAEMKKIELERCGIMGGEERER